MAQYIAEVWVRSAKAGDESDPYRSFWEEFASRGAAKRWAQSRLRVDRGATSADIHIVDDEGDWQRVESVGL